MLGAQRDRLGAVSGACNHGHVVLGAQERGEPLAHDLLVVGDERPDHGLSPSVGQLDVDRKATAVRCAAGKRASGDRRAVSHSHDPVAGRHVLGRAGAVVPDAKPQRRPLRAGPRRRRRLAGAWRRALVNASCTIR